MESTTLGNPRFLRLLMADFFKKRGFTTKKNGIEFLSSNKRIIEKIHESDEELNEREQLTIEEFGFFLDSFDIEKRVFLNKVKAENSKKLVQKKDLERQAMKDQIIKEYLEEQRKEKEDQEVKKILGDKLDKFALILKKPIIDFIDFISVNKIKMVYEDEKSIEKCKKEIDEISKNYLIIEEKITSIKNKYIE